MTKPRRSRKHRKTESSAAAADALFNAITWAAGKLVDGVRWAWRITRKGRGVRDDAPDSEN